MPFTANDLRYRAEQSYPLLYAYLHRNAQRYLGALKYDAFEVDTVIGHVVEQLVRLGILGGEDRTPKTALDWLTDAQFYTFLSRSVRNKAIDRLRKRRLQVNTTAELEGADEEEGDNPLSDAVESIWGETPFSTPEEISLHIASQRELRNILKHCITVLRAAPNQLQAVMQELQEIGADDLVDALSKELDFSFAAEPNPHISQHKDHAHKKLRNCLQQQSSNLTVTIALRLTMYTTKHSTNKNVYEVDVQTLAQHDLTKQDVCKGLQELVSEGLLDWHGEEIVQLTSAQLKRLSRFYKEE
ncbi:hypothetical protein [Dictyobacter formicarum]|uniref:RNA polymerase sigma-70 region 2 domain-containing protein n=1 Tax=Dictyobacter formicarum TaxID=2778368 RepID=A0ABQ3VVC5_9CHLR|nr:hypothetical protein [Dictyobacter formicarum]GHO89513.1 hypothetical protein KSZ_75190 [Dictyobacter formicarum]